MVIVRCHITLDMGEVFKCLSSHKADMQHISTPMVSVWQSIIQLDIYRIFKVSHKNFFSAMLLD